MTRLAPLCLAAFAVTYLWHTFTIPLDPFSAAEAINARTLPLIFGVALLAVSLGLAARPSTPEAEAAEIPLQRWRVLAWHAVAIIGFGVLIPWAGLWISLAALLVAGLLIAGERRAWILAGAPLVTAGLAWLLIGVVLGVYIDPGRWFS
ncbi:MAG: tripartite tricarboxylate transporter TctB family protein [Gammaproteobacteria bacterium]|nr:tripartite tricarboxylate transporter TctB family protein [Gammaproteobacteria bacterium]